MAGKAVRALNDIHPYQLFMLALCIFAITLVGADTLVPMDPETSVLLQYADTAVCILFLIDFVVTFIRAENRMRYMMTWGWLDLLSSIPAVDALRFGRLARLLRILRLLRAIRSARLVGQFIMAKRTESATLAAGLSVMLLIVCSSVAVLHFEMPAGGNISSAGDALWWSATTMTTVGYGDRFPITAGGRIVAVVLMAGGVGLFGTLSGLVAGWFVSPASKAATPAANVTTPVMRLGGRAPVRQIASPSAGQHTRSHDATAWLQTARELTAAARRVYDPAPPVSDLREPAGTSATAAALLAGSAIEAALKGLWVRTGHPLIVNGAYQTPLGLRSHQLKELAQHVAPLAGVPVTRDELGALGRLSTHVRDVRRYPAAPAVGESVTTARVPGAEAPGSNVLTGEDLDASLLLLTRLTEALQR
jgi:voltage-gated potassium channel